jgi:hypothetical protein
MKEKTLEEVLYLILEFAKTQTDVNINTGKLMDNLNERLIELEEKLCLNTTQ